MTPSNYLIDVHLLLRELLDPQADLSLDGQWGFLEGTGGEWREKKKGGGWEGVGVSWGLSSFKMSFSVLRRAKCIILFHQ